MSVEPRAFPGVMVSSTFSDFVEHREALVRAIGGQGLHPVAMEQDSARPLSVIESSLEKVRDSSAYVGVIGHKYGTVPESVELNPDGLSLTELEFREARRLGRPILLFVMGDDHLLRPTDVEVDGEKRRRLLAFREDAKHISADSQVDRVYKEFNSLHEFEVAVTHAVAELRRCLDAGRAPSDDEIPVPPAFYAEPRYIGSHEFVGRAEELRTLSDWASADSRPVLLYEAIGGTGKSMLTWEWTTRHATVARSDWAGVFWYSFYEKGAVMADFCARALAYMTGASLNRLRTKKQSELAEELLHRLRRRPWLLVLDGLERVLAGYHRYDAAQLADELAGATDEIARRDPCAAIRPEDEDLLQQLTCADPSKILITSRLVPQAVLNPSGQTIPGVLRQRLPGLWPADAEALIRACGVRGSPFVIRDYLRRHCDFHPLVTGIIAGLVENYLRSRGDFDAWAKDPGAGGRLAVGELNLVQKRNHILKAAITDLSPGSRQLLSVLALLPGAVDYATLQVFNPYPAEAEDAQAEALIQESLAWVVRDLERRGLLQYDRTTDRYDLHPVVRAVASGGLRSAERAAFGRRVVDHFSAQYHNPYEAARTLDDVLNGLVVVRTLLQMEERGQAYEAYAGGLQAALNNNLEAYPEILSLLRPFFKSGWTAPAAGVPQKVFSVLATDAGTALAEVGEDAQALAAHTAALRVDIRLGYQPYVRVDLSRIALLLIRGNHLFRAERALLATNALPGARLSFLALCGRWAELDALYASLDHRDFGETGAHGLAETLLVIAISQFHRGELTEKHLADVRNQAAREWNRSVDRRLYALRGEWLLDRDEDEAAADAFRDAIRMAHEVGRSDPGSEVCLALARQRLGHRIEADEIARLSVSTGRNRLALAELWLGLNDQSRAAEHARDAYVYAWADGEPYVRRHELTRAAALLHRLGISTPEVRPFDPARFPPEPWAAELAGF